MKLKVSSGILILSFLITFISIETFAQKGKSTYVKAYTKKNGTFVRGHGRKAVSTSANAYKSRAYSKSYYQRNKWRYKKH